MLLTQPLLPVRSKISGEFFIFQQNSAPALARQSGFYTVVQKKRANFGGL